MGTINKTRTVHSDEKLDETKEKQRGNFNNKVYSYVITISNLYYVTLSETLEEYEVTAEQYDIGLGRVEKKVSVSNKQKTMWSEQRAI